MLLNVHVRRMVLGAYVLAAHACADPPATNGPGAAHARPCLTNFFTNPLRTGGSGAHLVALLEKDRALHAAQRRAAELEGEVTELEKECQLRQAQVGALFLFLLNIVPLFSCCAVELEGEVSEWQKEEPAAGGAGAACGRRQLDCSSWTVQDND